MLSHSLKNVATPTTYCRQLFNIFGTSPDRKAALLADTGFTEADLKSGPEMVNLLSQLMFIKNLNILCGPGWMLDARQLWEPSMRGALGSAFRSSPNARVAIETIQGFSHLRAPHFTFSSFLKGDDYHINYKTTFHLPETLQQPITEAVALSAKSLLDNFINHDTDYLEIWWEGSAPLYQERLESFFPCQCRYNMDTGGIVFKATAIENVSPLYEPSLQRAASSELKRLQNAMASGDYFSQRVSQFLENTKANRPTADQTANALGVSRRTLSRRLKNAGTTFRALLDESLKQRAIHMRDLEQLSRIEIAERLGFDDPTSLSRAWRRWFNET